MNSNIVLETPRKVEIVEVIHVLAARGNGTEGNPVRVIDQYWSKSGVLLAEKDCAEGLDGN
ncbi:hypothetical protein [Carnobacterium maltaromaticum]|uniref:hypothetical protein n=1 Tax=Carnobacterium maltaromaticum TaxID=2751 RepID=UPI001071866E|nr:hypothetical protein [Carnobacterium maltaromaticum]TFJ76292.1 hypothetical protein CKN94_02680 [Carnobacterium maltaromaticum]TFJ79092.1 hypothetical protein CKN97_02675 [Carnobacterium maltaromaticum]